MLQSTIKLYKKIPIDNIPNEIISPETAKLTIKETIPFGFILSNEIYVYFDAETIQEIIKIVKEELTLSGKEMNASFHKSWDKIKTASTQQLVVEQIAHYITTYGFENLGLGYNEDFVYIPNEPLNIPEITNPIQIMIIKPCTFGWLYDKVIELVNSGIALEEETIKAVMDILITLEVNIDEINDIANKEVKTRLCKHYNILPENPIDFLRYLIYETTENTLLIKDAYTINTLKNVDEKIILNIFMEYLETYTDGYKNLASIFYRFKPLFLACKRTKMMNKIINKIRRFAKKYHVPMKEDYLNNITSMIKNRITIDYEVLINELAKVNTFRKVRLLEALNYRSNLENNSIIYKIRNGKSYATTLENINSSISYKYEFIALLIIDNIINDMKKNVEGKNIYIPKDIEYALPSSEKQFFGNIPSGSCINVNDGDIVFGVHWENIKNHRIDLDLSLTTLEEKIGWDGVYRDEERSVLFSGDVTDAPKSGGGASEMFYISKYKNGSYVNYLNFYNYMDNIDVPYKFYIGSQKVKDINRNFMINPNNVICVIPNVLKEQQNILGFVDNKEGQSKYYFVGIGSGKGRTININSTFQKEIFNFLLSKSKNSIKLNNILTEAGANVISKIEEDVEIDIDLSPAMLEKDTIINLFQKEV